MEQLSKNKIKLIRSLRQKKKRDEHQLFVIEGQKIVSEIVRDFPGLIDSVITTDTSFDFPNCYEATEAQMKEITSLSTASDYLAIVKRPTFESLQENFVLAIDGVQDPGNMGTIIRSAVWFGVEKIVCSRDCADVFSAKVAQASMGTLFNIPIETVDLPSYLKESSLPIYGALLNGEPLSKAKLSTKAILVVGSEGQGISKEVQDCIDHAITIEGSGGTESLNVSVATGVLLREFFKLK